MSAIVGAAGLAPGLRLAEHGGVLALANKESMVCAGDLVTRTCAAHGTRLIPVDSEHSAIFQALRGEAIDEVERHRAHRVRRAVPRLEPRGGWRR